MRSRAARSAGPRSWASTTTVVPLVGLDADGDDRRAGAATAPPRRGTRRRGARSRSGPASPARSPRRTRTPAAPSAGESSTTTAGRPGRLVAVEEARRGRSSAAIDGAVRRSVHSAGTTICSCPVSSATGSIGGCRRGGAVEQLGAARRRGPSRHPAASSSSWRLAVDVVDVVLDVGSVPGSSPMATVPAATDDEDASSPSAPGEHCEHGEQSETAHDGARSYG